MGEGKHQLVISNESDLTIEDKCFPTTGYFNQDNILWREWMDLEPHRNDAPDFTPQSVQRDMAHLAYWDSLFRRNKTMNKLMIWFLLPGIRGDFANKQLME